MATNFSKDVHASRAAASLLRPCLLLRIRSENKENQDFLVKHVAFGYKKWAKFIMRNLQGYKFYPQECCI